MRLEDAMPGTPVKHEQFALEGDDVVHTPTGARFTAYPGIARPHTVNWGRCGEVLPNGDDYRRDEVGRMATDILAARMRK
jgi:hypothetical protein